MGGRHFAGTTREDVQKSQEHRPKAVQGSNTRRFRLAVPVAIACAAVFAMQGFCLATSLPSARVLALLAASIVSVATIAFLSTRVENNEAAAQKFVQRVFVVAFVGLGVLYCVFFPPNTVPDEEVHYSATYGYVNLLDPTMGAHDVRKEDQLFMQDETLFARELRRDFWDRKKNEGLPVFATESGAVQDEEFAHNIDFGTDAPQLKIFGAIGVLLARWCGLSGVLTFYIGRFFNLAACLAIIIVAIRLLPVGRNIFMTIALLPMTLHLIASYSYDSLIIAYAFMLTSLVLRAILGKGHMSGRLKVSCVVVGALLAPCKIAYVVLSLLALAVPSERFASKKSEWVWKACMLAIPILVIVIMRLGKLLLMAGASDEQNRSVKRSATKSVLTFGDAVSQPGMTISIFLRALYRHCDFYLTSLVGGSLGWFQENIQAFHVQEFALVFALACSAISSVGDKLVLSRRLRVVCAAVFCMGVVLVFLGMMFVWTVVGADAIQGVQGRYLLPMLPLALLALRGNVFEIKDDIGITLLAALAGFNCFYLAQIAFVVLGGTI